jgi:pilus assembly protein CpaB
LALDDMLGGGARRGPPRRSGTRALTFWAVALIAGGSAALLLRWYVERSAQPVSTPMTKIVVAAVDLPIATTLRPEHLRLADWPAGNQPTGVLHDIKDLPGRVVISKVVQGEPLLAVKLASKDAGRGLAALIPEGMRGVAVRVDEVVGVAGFIHPEDRVDVIATMGARGGAGSGETISKVVLQNVKVLAVGKDLDISDYDRSKAVAVTVVTVLVTPPEAEKLALVANITRLTLTLRSWTDDKPAETPGASSLSILNGVEAIRRPQAIAAAPVVEPPSRRGKRGRLDVGSPAPSVNTTPQREVVEILRGDRLEERKFDKEKP